MELPHPRAIGPEAVIHGDGVWLRRWPVADAPALESLVGRNLDHLRPWMPWIASEPLSIDERLELMATWHDDWDENREFGYAVMLEDELIGGCGLHHWPGPDGLALGYWIDVVHIGRGLATAVARALTNTAFAVDHITHTMIRHDVANRASGRVPAELGYRKIGEEPHSIDSPGQTGVSALWRAERSEWAPTSSR